MEFFSGLDVGMDETAICVVDDKGKVVLETTVVTDPEAIKIALKPYLGRLRRVGHEAGALSPWLWLVGFAVLTGMIITHFNFILLIILVLSLPRLFFLFRRKTEEERRYFEVTPGQRLQMAGLYFGLIALLVYGMKLTLIPREALQ